MLPTLNFQGWPSGRKTRFSEIDKWRTSQRFGGNGASTDSESSQGMQLGCCRPERRSGTSCNETIHASVENAKAWNHAWFGIAAAAILWTPLPVSITVLCVPGNWQLTILLAPARGQLDLKNGLSVRHPNTNQ